MNNCIDCGTAVAKRTAVRCRKCFYKWMRNNPQIFKSYNGGRYKHPNGYVVVKRLDHPHATTNGRIMEHRLVMEEKIGRYLSEDEVVHHINGIKNDNRIENLVLCRNQSEHSHIHNDPNKQVCKECGETHYAHGLCLHHYNVWYFQKSGKENQRIRRGIKAGKLALQTQDPVL